MIRKIQIAIIVTSLFFMHSNSFAQTTEWKTETSDDGKVSVKYGFSERIGANGEKNQVVEYVATTTTNVSLKRLVAVVKDVSKHKDFMAQKISNKLKNLNDNECVVYYFYEGVWPYPSSDIVAKMICNESVNKKQVRFTITAAPTLFEDKKVKRLEYYNLCYAFADLGNGSIEISLSVKFTPAVQLPAFIASSWFPDGPADYLTQMIRLANEMK